MKVLALGEGNAARSPIAHGWLRALSAADVLVYSAGTSPRPIAPEAVRVMAEVGIDLAAHRPTRVTDVPDPDVVIRLCAPEIGPAYAGDTVNLAWSAEIPDEAGTADGRMQAYRRLRDELGAQVDPWLKSIGRRIEFGLRDAFGLRSGITFLNNGSFGATPRIVLAAQRRLQDELEAQPVAFMRALPARVRRVAALAASAVRADPQDVVFVDNASTGVTAVLRSMSFQAGDVVYVTNHGYGAVRAALEHLKRRIGIQIVVGEVPFPLSSPQDVLDVVDRTLPDHAKLAIFDHITSPTGLVFPVGELVARCRSAQIPVLIDGAHVPGHIPVDLGALDADYWVGNLHKWSFTPKGCAILRVRPDRRDTLDPVVFSHEIGKGLAPAFDFQGTRDPSPWLATEAALAFVEMLGGVDRIRAHNVLLRRAAGALLCERWGVEPPAPPEMLGAMLTLPLPFPTDGALSTAVALNARLWEEHKVEVVFVPFNGQVWLRISAQIFNNIDDYERLAQVLRDFKP